MQEQTVCLEVFQEKYAKDGETTHDDVFRRVAKGLAAAEKEEDRARYEALFYDNMKAGAVGAGRIMSAAGTGISATLANCFVQPIGDCMQGHDDDGYPGIYEALRSASETMRRGGGVGYDFSRIRPRNAFVKGTHSYASGPCSFMDVYDASCRTVESAGSRRGAQMGILRIDHPDIVAFISAKRTPGRWNNFNVSVGVSDAFMEAVASNSSWHLVHKAAPSQKLIDDGAYQRDDGMWVYETVEAKALWDLIMQSTYDYAEPGIVFLSNMNKDNNLRAVETIEATNPCGEQPLPPHGCCDLGPINLTRFIDNPFGLEQAPVFNWAALEQAVTTQVRMLDNVLDVTLWPLAEQQQEARNKRRIGVGFTGLGNALAMMLLRYDSVEGRVFAAEVAEKMRNAAYRASVELAKERGSFPLFNADRYLEDGTFASRLPDDVKADIRQHGIRNSHLLSIAPVGTISLGFFDNASNGIEPPFSLGYERKKRMPDDTHQIYPCLDHAFRVYMQEAQKLGRIDQSLVEKLTNAVAGQHNTFVHEEREVRVVDYLPPSFVTALEMSAQDHLLMMAAVQPFIDAAISKTVNVPEDYSFEDFKGLYMTAWQLGLKGVATYRPNNTLGAVLSVKQEEKPATPAVEVVPDIDPLKVVIEKRPMGSLPSVTEKFEYFTSAGRKALYVTVSFAKVQGRINGQDIIIERPVEFFLPAGQEGDAQQWITAAMRSLSLVARGGLIAKALQDYRKVTWDRGPVRMGTKERFDGAKIPLVHDSEVAAIAYGLQQILFRNGFLDVDGNQVPVNALIHKASAPEPVMHYKPADTNGHAQHRLPITSGKRCAECNALAVIPRNGCEVCDNCGTVGSCG